MATAYQRAHRPVRTEEVRCDGAVVDGRCGRCGRYLRRRGPHLPDRDGQFGVVHHYADGSTRVVGPEET